VKKVASPLSVAPELPPPGAEAEVVGAAAWEVVVGTMGAMVVVGTSMTMLLVVGIGAT
jgi:hypothetical protein